MKTRIAIVLGLCVALASSAFGYEVVAVEDGGSLKGKITGKGAAGAAIAVSKDQQVCHNEVPDESLLLGEGNGLANAVVYFVEVEAGKDPAAEGEALLSNKECRYVPHVQSMTVGNKLVIENSDPILHNTHTYDAGEKTVFNLALPIQGQKINKKMKKPGLVNAKCDAGHTWMDAYVWVNENPYHATTDANGNFEITDIPEGDYTVVVWHEKLGTSEHEVTIDAGAAAELNVGLGE